MKISVIVPYKDSAAWLGRCIDSLVDQPGNFEFLLINDKSKDEGPEIAAEYEDDRIVLLDNEHKSGVSGARNTGLDHATGDWITFLDADDTMNRGAWKMFEAAIGSDKKAEIFQFNHYRHYAKINRTRLKYTNPAGVYGLKEFPVLWCVVWNKLYKAELLDGLRYDETMKFGEDELFNLEVFARDSRIVCIKDVTTTHIFQNETSLSKTKKEADLFRQAQKIMAFIRDHDDPNLRRAACLRLSTHWSHMFLDTLVGGE